MLPTPSTSHVDFARIYEPAEDSYLLLDTLSSESEISFLQSRCTPAAKTGKATSSPLVIEIGTGSGVVLSFIHANAEAILGRQDVLTAGVDINSFACEATKDTVSVVEQEHGKSHGFYLGNVLGDLTSALRQGQVDVLVFNPPYVPSSELPALPKERSKKKTTFDEDSHLLELSYAGGADGMETTDRLLECLPEILNEERGCAYILLCVQNKPEEVKERIRTWGNGWTVRTVASSGKKAGWEKLQVVRIWRMS